MSPWNVLLHGARGDGRTNDTAAIQQAIDECAKSGGGRVELPAGHVFLSGSLNLRGHVELFIEGGSTLKASGNRDDFRTLGALLFADHADGVEVGGSGTIDGNFHAFLTARTADGYNVTQPFLGPYDPLYDKPGRDHPDGRPRVILLVGCSHVRIRDIIIRDSPTWTVHLLGCDDVRISGVTIHNNLDVPNCDGVDIDHCRHVRVEGCNIEAGDDCLVLKASRNFRDFGVCEDITITNCTLRSRSAAIKIEPEGPDTVRAAIISNCTIDHSNRGISILNRDGALIEDLIFSDMVIGTELQPEMWWGSGEPVHVSTLPRSHGLPSGAVRNLQFSRLTCRGENGIYLQGSPGSPLTRLRFSEIDVTLQKTSALPGGYYDLRPIEGSVGIVYRRSAASVAKRSPTSSSTICALPGWGRRSPITGRRSSCETQRASGCQTSLAREVSPANLPKSSSTSANDENQINLTGTCSRQ